MHVKQVIYIYIYIQSLWIDEIDALSFLDKLIIYLSEVKIYRKHIISKSMLRNKHKYS